MAVTEDQYRDITGARGPQLPDDTFPASSGDRERGKFRRGPLGQGRLTSVAVTDNDGNPIGSALVPSFDGLVEEMRRLRLAMTLQGTAANLGDLDDLILE